MPYWQWYLVIGLVLAVPMVAILAKEIWVNLSEKAKRPAPAQAFRSYVLVVLVTTILWPLFVPFILYEKWTSRRDEKQRKSEERIFAPGKEDLVSSFTVEEIEAHEIVNDPLGGAPRLPFGHLHGAWEKFLMELPAGAQLWSYAVVWENRWRTQEQREGYVAVVDDGIGPFFETVNYRLEDQA
ncbi:hypothetical protein [Croceicoccus bisphenolivorans]|jgi:hypothetical protein|uniref:hypothetical protein n=1 Tax=Croceicoccus bisphenolivorans TaxID=1783232 RepID=UPI00083260CD|nr:hypothetical protein [Croceicoccus bisphenolivorans]